MGDFVALRFSSADFPARDRVEATREIYGRAILRLELEPLPGSPFQIEASLRVMSGLGIAVGSCSRVRCRHTATLIDSDDLILSVASAGGGTMRQHGHEVAIKDGEAVLSASSEPGVHTYHSDSRFLTFRLSRAAMSSLVADLHGALLQPVPRHTPALRLLTRYVGLLDDAAGSTAPMLQHLVASHVHDLAALALGATRDAAEAARGRGVRAARLQAIKADIVMRLAHPGLSAHDIAARHRISERYLRKLLAADGTSFSAFVLDQRVARAHRLLTDPRAAERSIGSIAFRVGFGDLSYFNRAFRRRYGASPSDVRAAARQQG
ncbi:AraC family transcriptional regulator [Vineibacter terrae]|uniref:AraC family transcriptional regulator n=1 Tax=Vineibacter terrae TaxID=2586908 RepID=UPI002E36ACA9|nr:AraC family transcriptional regulator [Vineibacter terrae]HEX2889897.1 AraC family transcriptional regulator [Vineibacter terrae]